MTSLHTALDKASWGFRVVGPIDSMIGLGRWIRLRVTRPPRAEVTLRSGPALEFDLPGQFPSTLVLFGDFIDPEYAFFAEVRRANWRIIDVGAAIGQFSIFAALRLSSAEIVAFEPSRANVATLRRNVQKNGVSDQVSIRKAALGVARGLATFVTSPIAWYSGMRQSRADGGTAETVDVETLDRIISSDWGHVDLLKINVAGYEPDVLEGGLRSLEEGRVDFLVLLLGLASLPYYEKIAAFGYRFFYYHPRQKTLFEVRRFDEASVLSHRPWPARHILAIRSEVVDDLVKQGFSIRQTR